MSTITAQTARALLQWTTTVTIGPDGYYVAYRGTAAGGAVDYDTPYITRKIPAWPTRRYPGGYGSGPYGSGAYGHGYLGGVGYGRGPYGRGPYGRGATILQAVGPPLADGTWSFAVVGYDDLGNADPSGDRLTDSIALAGTPEPPGEPDPSAWAAGTGTVTVDYDVSTDDS